jgi:uncharacterized protein related to proFAR isomerase
MNETEKRLMDKLEPEPETKTEVLKTETEVRKTETKVCKTETEVKRQETIVGQAFVTLDKNDESANQENDEINKMVVTVRELEEYERQESERKLAKEPLIRE